MRNCYGFKYNWANKGTEQSLNYKRKLWKEDILLIGTNRKREQKP